MGLLQTELAYNETLKGIVEQIQTISGLLDIAQDAAVQDQVSQALDRLQEVDKALAQLGDFENTRVVGVLRSRSSQLKAAILENTAECWSNLLVVDYNERRITAKNEIQSMSAYRLSDYLADQ